MAQSNAYYGVAPNDIVDAEYRYAYIATSGQTTFSASYTPGSVDVFLNGSKILPSEFTATDGTSVVLGTAAVLDDEVQIVSRKVTPVVGAVSPVDLSNGLATKVSTTGNEGIAGVKTFTDGALSVNAVAATVRAATTDLTGESLEGTLSDTGVAITAFHGVAGITYKRKCLGAGDITAGAGLTILQGGATIPTAAGDTFEVYLLTATTCEVRNYQRAIDPKTAEIANTTANTANTTANNALAGGHYGQTWQPVTRTAGTTYYNVTGRPIILRKSFDGSGATIRVTISINGGTPFDFARHSSGNAATPQIVGNCLIPNDASYLLTEISVASGVSTELR